jgi:hypothetical protein
LNGAGGGIRTHEPLRDEVLSLAPLTRLGDSRAGMRRVANNGLKNLIEGNAPAHGAYPRPQLTAFSGVTRRIGDSPSPHGFFL